MLLQGPRESPPVIRPATVRAGPLCAPSQAPAPSRVSRAIKRPGGWADSPRGWRPLRPHHQITHREGELLAERHRLVVHGESRRVRSLAASIQTAAGRHQSPMATAVLAVGPGSVARNLTIERRHRAPLHQPRARLLSSNRPTRAIRPVPAGAGGQDLDQLLVSPLLEKAAEATLRGRRRPGSPCRANRAGG